MNFKFERDFKAEVIFETSVAINGYSYLIIYGKHINGYFCSVPNWNWGCEMAEPSDTGYNSEQLVVCGADKEIALAIAEAIAAKCENGE